MLESVMTRTRAKLLMLIGWMYCILLATTSGLSPQGNDPHDIRCQRHPIPQTIAGASGISFIVSVFIIQVKTLLILKERTQPIRAQPGSQTGQTLIPTGRMRLYKRAMVTTVAIAVVYAIPWVPTLILYILNVWSIGNNEIVQELLTRCSFVPFVIQSFANAFIFQLKNLDQSCFTLCRKSNRVSSTAIPLRVIAVQSRPVEQSPRSVETIC